VSAPSADRRERPEPGAEAWHALKVLGIWDGHDAGAALLVDGRLVAAANEERFTRRKLEVCFPDHAIESCLSAAALARGDIDIIATCTMDPAKAVGRMWPATKESYYRIRRRQVPLSIASRLRVLGKYEVASWAPSWWSRRLNEFALVRALERRGFSGLRLRAYDHHLAHAATAAYGSGFRSCAVMTVDGVGDGVAATVARFSRDALRVIARTPAAHSPGIFFEHVTALLNMRELEDEGKVMALADFSAPLPDSQNPLLQVLRAHGLTFRVSRSSHRLRRELRQHQWFMPNEQFARAAQTALERACVSVAQAAVRPTGERRLALAGGVASNVRINAAVRRLPDLERVFVFPHMGDGGLACGAAMLASAEHGVQPSVDLRDLGLGPEFSPAEIEAALADAGVSAAKPSCLATAVAELLQTGAVVLWFQGRMEYGPRALGHRSILARADLPAMKDRLNLVLKRRTWYQPFCPSMLAGEAAAALEDWDGIPNHHMTMAYQVRQPFRGRLAAAVQIDGSCRPQIVPEDDPGVFARLLHAMRRLTGYGAVLNTSFNVHGQPMVCTPTEAIATYQSCDADALAIGDYFVR